MLRAQRNDLYTIIFKHTKMNIDYLYNTALNSFHEKLEMHYIHAVSKLSLNQDLLKYQQKVVFTDKLDDKLIEKFLHKRGYVLNVVLGYPVWVKGFVCVRLHAKVIEVWIDKQRKPKSVFIYQSYLTGLPLTLNYMEKYL